MPATSMSPTRRAKHRVFCDELYSLLRRYQRGEIKGNNTGVGQLDQPLTQVYDEIIAMHERVYESKKPRGA